MSEGHKRFTHTFPPVLRADLTPTWTEEAANLPKTERYCTCCQRPLARKFAYLELDQTVNAYHDFGGVPPDRSQGWFPFGLTCARKLLGQAKSKLRARAA